MIIDLQRNLAFIHIPRTGGTSISIWWAKYAFHNACTIDLMIRKHANFFDIKKLIGQDIQFFTIWRDLNEIKQSLTRLVNRDKQFINDIKDKNWANVLNKIPDNSDPETIFNILWGQHDEKSWRLMWLCGHDNQIHILSFSNLQKDWKSFTKKFELPDYPLEKFSL